MMIARMKISTRDTYAVLLLSVSTITENNKLIYILIIFYKEIILAYFEIEGVNIREYFLAYIGSEWHQRSSRSRQFDPWFWWSQKPTVLNRGMRA